MFQLFVLLYSLLVSTFLLKALARSGIDLSMSITSQTWADTVGIDQVANSFAVIHGAFYNNTINPAMSTLIHTGWSIGVSELSVYVYPCIQKSPYAINNHISCGTAEEQIDRLISDLHIRGIAFRHYNWSAYDVVYDRNPPHWNTTATNVTLQTLYINVEDNIPNYYFSYNHYENVDFLAKMKVYAERYKGIEVGIYTTPTDWNNIMTDIYAGQRVYFSVNGTKYNQTNPFEKHKLWLPRYDQAQNFDFFAPFEGWTQAYIKQISGGSKDQRRIGSSRVCLDYIEDVVNATTSYTVPLF